MRIVWLALALTGLSCGGAAAADAGSGPASALTFTTVPGGCFTMGDTTGQGAFHERPAHEVCLDSFALGTTEVTHGQWRAVMGDAHPLSSGDPDTPVQGVTIGDIDAFLARLNGLGAGRFRLPTEAEWEYACRAGGDQEYGTATGAISPREANVEGGEDGWDETAPVGRYPPNALGLLDMSGNLWEWVEDVYAADAYGKHAAANPVYREAGPSRVLRGGGWSFEPESARCRTRRMNCRPSVRYDFVGLRLVRLP